MDFGHKLSRIIARDCEFDGLYLGREQKTLDDRDLIDSAEKFLVSL